MKVVPLRPPMELSSPLEAEAIALVRSRLAGVDPAHGWEHVERVLHLATELARKYKVDLEVVRLACIFHDVEREHAPEDHSRRSAILAEDFLRARGYPWEKVKRIKAVILAHHLPQPQGLEETILWDADKLDALGPVGLARCLQEAGYKGQSITQAISHLEGDIRQFGQAIHLKEAKALARRKVEMAWGMLTQLREDLGI